MKIFILLLATTGLLIVSVIFLIYIFRQARKRSRWQDDILASFQDKASHGSWYRAHYASASRFKSIWKLFPWAYSGIMFMETGRLTFAALKGDGEPLTIHFSPAQTKLAWLGPKPWPNGAMPWFCLTENGQQHYFTADSGATILNSRTLTSDIYHQLKRVLPDMEFDASAERLLPGRGFALEKNRYSLGAMIMMAVLVVYALLDYMLNFEDYIGTHFINYTAWASVLVMLSSMVIFKKNQIPVLENIVLSFFLSCSVGLATPQVMLRINQLTDQHGLKAYPYHLTDSLGFTPVGDFTDLPELYFPGNKDYWSQLDKNAVHEFELRKGGLGFYQVNMAPVYVKMRKYYQEKYKSEQKNKAPDSESKPFKLKADFAYQAINCRAYN